MYKITHKLAPYFKSILVDSIGRSDVYTYSFDESLNEIKELSEMDLYFRFWNADFQFQISWLYKTPGFIDLF